MGDSDRQLKLFVESPFAAVLAGARKILADHRRQREREMKKEAKFQARQGDVFIERVAELPKGLKEVKADKGRTVLAYGEVTGHAHALPAASSKLYRGKDAGFTSYLKVMKKCDLRHDEHGAIALSPGNYAVTTQMEYAPNELRAVAD